MKLIKAHPKLAIAIGVIILLFLTIFIMYLAHPITTLVIICIASGLGYISWRSYNTPPNNILYTKSKLDELLVDCKGWLLFALFCYVFMVLVFIHDISIFKSYLIYLRKSDYSMQQVNYIRYQTSRLSCNEIVYSTRTDTIVDTGYTATRYSLFNKNKEVYFITGTYVKSSATTNDTVVDTLRIYDVTCGDTVTTIKRKPYSDRNFSLIRTNKKFIDSYWTLVDTTYFSNMSPHIGTWELNAIFNNARAEYTYDKYITKYTLKLIDEAKSDTLDSKDDAIGLLNTKCKDKSTVAGKLIYAEYDACKNNNSVSTIKINKRAVCGYGKVLLEYDRGSVAGTPDNCMYKANYGWTYE